MKSRWTWAIAAVLVALTSAPAVSATATPSHAVPHSYLVGLREQALHPGQTPPGANDWKCRPTAAHPEPVILLHGFVSTSTLTWQTVAPLLANQRYCVYTLDYGVVAGVGGLAPIEVSATQLAQFVRRVLVATGAHQVDIVGHSEGATMPFYYLKHTPGAASTIRRYVSLAALNRGTTQAGFAPLIRAALAVPAIGRLADRDCGPCHQLLAGSSFLRNLNIHGSNYPAIDFTNIVTRFDQIATPYTTGLLDGRNVENIVVQQQCADDYTDHLELPSDPITARLVLNALDPSHPKSPTCRPVAPIVGPVTSR
ncbi:alpha/beta fold hydrolase [Gordonia sp. ABSL1-1]|uniref:esterase/lipase family protein n=1 Tax=Gordonia sp. ABSL1-1 TaxID=3053923 RepID=UPI00257395CD|nr:alpha/beta fold hydrolase [Gordonia sp. ABSL1-1]MDL9935989.1 alpha/beta fold hydrolase [Gordonia sp. ABSL1-1]